MNPEKSIHLTKHINKRASQPDRPDIEDAVAAAKFGHVSRSKVQDDGAVIEHRIHVDGTIVVVAVNPHGLETLVTTYRKYRLQLIVLSESIAVNEEILQHRENLNALQRTDFARRAGSGVCDVVITNMLSFLDEEHRDALVVDEVREYSEAQTGIKAVGVNPDFCNLYLKGEQEQSVKALLERGSFITGVELPTPEAGYHTLDILGCATSTSINTEKISIESATLTLQKRMLIELGIILHSDFFTESKVVEECGVPFLFYGGKSSVGKHLPVTFMTISIPPDAHVYSFSCSLRSHPDAIDQVNGLSYLCIVPSGTSEEDALKVVPFHYLKTKDAPDNDGETIICRDCSKSFTFSSEEKKNFKRNGWSKPKRCIPCRGKKSKKSGDVKGKS